MKLQRAVIGGTSVIISIENLEPIIVYDLKRNRSPNTNPTNPDNVSHNQFSELASVGSNMPREKKVKILRKISPITSLRILTATEPILWLADSNVKDVIVQKNVVSNAANSPIWLLKKSIVYEMKLGMQKSHSRRASSVKSFLI